MNPRMSAAAPHPYADLPPEAFWRSGVVQDDPFAPAGLVRPKFRVGRGAAVVTAGSCFARHLGGALTRAGVGVMDAEPAPTGMTASQAAEHGYGLFSARWGNIYTVRQMRQLVEDAGEERVDPEAVWQRPDGRHVDALRPRIDPAGFDTPDEVLACRRLHLAAVRSMLGRATHLVLTLGLTEAWAGVSGGRVYPMAPGIVAGTFDPARYRLLNMGWADVTEDLAALRIRLRQINRRLRIILSVSPVPLTATATGQHVLAANARSKAVLRAAAGEFADRHADVDYFPAYEIVTNPATHGALYRDGLREVRPQGVEAVMRAFLAAHDLGRPQARRAGARRDRADAGDAADAAQGADRHCDERLLDALGRA